MESVLKKKAKAAVGRICRKECFKPGMKECGDERIVVLFLDVLASVQGYIVNYKFLVERWCVLMTGAATRVDLV